ncbi:MAG: hypothetical protein CUN55_19410, partial [Phototrophicales bacterium]
SDEIITEAQWSSDGRYILYHVDGGPLRLMPADGKTLLTVYDNAVTMFDLAPTISASWRAPILVGLTMLIILSAQLLHHTLNPIPKM